MPVSPQFEFHAAISAAEGGTAYAGIEGLRKWAEEIDTTWHDYHSEVVEVHTIDADRVLIVFDATGKARASGVPLDIRGALIWTLQNGRLCRSVAYLDPHKAFEAAGLSE